MGLIDTSVTTNGTLAKGMTNLTAAQAVMNRLMPGTSSVVMGTLSKGVSTAIGTVGGAVGFVESEVGGALKSAATSAFSSVGSFFSSIDSKVSKSAASLFSDTTNANAQNVKDVIPSATTSSFAKGTPNSKVFSTNKMTAAASPVNLSGDATSSTYSLSNILGGGTIKTTSVVAQRLGVAPPTTVTGVNTLQQTALASTTAGYMNGQYEDLVNPTLVSSSAASTESSLASALGLTDYQNTVGGLASSLTGSPTGLDSFYNGSLPQVADATTGAVVDSNGLSASQYQSITGILEKLGCGSGGIYSSYSSQLSMYNLLMQIAGATGSQSLLTSLLSCNMVNTPFGMASASNVFKSTISSLPGAAETIMNSLGPSTVGMNSALATAAVSNTAATKTDATAVQSILNTSGYTTASVYGSGTTIGSTPVYDTRKLSASNDTMLTTLFGPTSSVPSTVSSGNVALTLTPNGTYSSVNTNTLGTGYDWDSLI